jgi:ABC-type multidrug transport system ATPase subunit
LTKRFGALVAVNGVSFQVRRGEVVALWGPNGAGKTTILRCLLGLLSFEGTAIISGHDVRRESKEVRRLVGYLPQDVRLHGDWTVAETLRFYARLRKVATERVEALMAE